MDSIQYTPEFVALIDSLPDRIDKAADLSAIKEATATGSPDVGKLIYEQLIEPALDAHAAWVEEIKIHRGWK